MRSTVWKDLRFLTKVPTLPLYLPHHATETSMSPDSMMGFLWIALVMGVAGSAHCIGMCGGFAVLAGSGIESTSRTRLNLAAWLTGKTLTYAALGLVLGSISGAVPRSFTGFQTVAAILTALLMIMIGLHMAGVGPSWRLVAPSPVSGFVTRMASLVRKSSVAGRFTLGLLNGLLPCGLVYAALAYSLTLQSAAKGAMFMAIFGFGTAPVLALIGLGTGVFNMKLRHRVTKLLGWVVVVAGAYTFMRLPAFMHAMG